VVTDRRDKLQWADSLYTQPVPQAELNCWLEPEGVWETSPLGEQTALNPILNMALWTIKDAGIWADVHRYRTEDGHQREFHNWEDRVNKMEQFAEAEHCTYINVHEESLHCKAYASQCLLAARAMSKALNII
jgi:hypothetical protein